MHQFISVSPARGGAVWDGVGEQEAITGALTSQPGWQDHVRYVDDLCAHPAALGPGTHFAHFHGNQAKHRIPATERGVVLDRWQRAAAAGSLLPPDLARFHWCRIQNSSADEPFDRGGPERFFYSPRRGTVSSRFADLGKAVPVYSSRHPAGTVLFVHGLSGDPWTAWGTPDAVGSFLIRLAAERPDWTVTSYQYPSSLDRVLLEPSVTADELGRQLAVAVQGLLRDGPRRLTLVGYCMGGALLTIALRRFGTFAAEFVAREAGSRCSCLTCRTRGSISTGICIARSASIATALTPTHRTGAPGPDPGIVGYTLLSQDTAGWVQASRRDPGLPTRRMRTFATDHIRLPQVPAKGPCTPYEFVRDAVVTMTSASYTLSYKLTT